MYLSFLRTVVFLRRQARQAAHHPCFESVLVQAAEVEPVTGFTITGTGLATSAYNAAGNITTIPQPGSLANWYTTQYDAWNQTVELKNGTTTDVGPRLALSQSGIEPRPAYFESSLH